MLSSSPARAARFDHPRIELVPTVSLRPAHRNARTHSKRQIGKIADSIRAFGFLNPVLVDSEYRTVADHGRVAAALQLGIDRVPVLVISHLSEAELRAYAIADNRLAELAGWDRDTLAIELGELAVEDRGR